METDNQIYISSTDEIMRYTETPIGAAFLPTGVKVVKVKPTALVTIPMMPLKKWQEMIGFFLWGQKEHRAEQQLSWFLNAETEEWMMLPFFQKNSGSMTTQEIAGEDNNKLWDMIRETGFGPNMIGTGHHHCTTSAFQSGTDADDEMRAKTQGYHVTIGKLGDSILDLHKRVKLTSMGTFDPETGDVLTTGQSIQLDFNILELVETPIPLDDIDEMSDPLIKSLTEHYLLKKVEYEFPEEWKSRIIKPTVTTYHPQGSNYRGSHGQNSNQQRPITVARQPSMFTMEEVYPFDDICNIIVAMRDLVGLEALCKSGVKLFEKGVTDENKASIEAFAKAIDFNPPVESNYKTFVEAFRIAASIFTEINYDNADLPYLFWTEMDKRVFNAFHDSEFTMDHLKSAFTTNTSLNILTNDPAFQKTGMQVLALRKQTGHGSMIQDVYDRCWKDFAGNKRKYSGSKQVTVYDASKDDNEVLSLAADTWVELDADSEFAIANASFPDWNPRSPNAP